MTSNPRPQRLPLTFTWFCDQASIDASATVTIEASTAPADRTAGASPYGVPDGAAANNPGVTVVKDNPAAGTDQVTLTASQAPDAKKFARLKVAIAP